MNIFKYILRYFTLFVLFILLILLTKFYGDYSIVVYFFLFILPVIVVLIIINLLILYKMESRRDNSKVFRITISILLLLCLMNLSIGFIDSKRTVVMCMTQENGSGTSRLLLYKNSTYKITTFHPHGTSNYSGKYRLENNILELSDTLIEKKTSNGFTNIYKLNKKSNQFEPTNSSFSRLEIEK